MKLAPNKINALKNAVTQQIQSFLGLTNYLKLFIPDYITLTCPLRAHTKKSLFGLAIKKAFDALKNILTSDSCIQYFDEKEPVILSCDVIPVRISAVLLQ